MQTTPLPIQLTSASPNPAPQRANAAASADARQFSQALSREMEQRQHSAAPVKAQQPRTEAPAKASADAGDDAEKDDAAALTPVTDMLALVASFKQPVAAAPAAAPAADSLAANVAADASELPALTGKQLAGEIDADALTGKVPAGGKEPALMDMKQPPDGALRFAVKIPGGAVAPDAKPKDAVLAAGSKTAPATGAVQKPDADLSAITKTEAVLPRAEVAPLRAREAVAEVAALKEAAAAAPVTAPVQQASLAMAQAVTGAPAERIAARVGTPGWDSQVGQKIIWMVAGKEQSASLTLNPPDMGPMQVVLSVTNDQATVTFSAAQPEVRQALENAMPKLREMMGESGIALGNATVNAGTPDQRQAQQGEQPRNQGSGTRFGSDGAQVESISLAPSRPGRSGGGTGLVDTFA
jgi:flagellar hook-length control protein FliK